MATYSIALKGLPASKRTSVTPIDTVPDLSQDGSAAATLGGFQATCQSGDWMLVKGLDGSFYWATYDAERSTFALPVLRKMTG